MGTDEVRMTIRCGRFLYLLSFVYSLCAGLFIRTESFLSGLIWGTCRSLSGTAPPTPNPKKQFRGARFSCIVRPRYPILNPLKLNRPVAELHTLPLPRQSDHFSQERPRNASIFFPYFFGRTFRPLVLVQWAIAVPPNCVLKGKPAV